MALEVRMDDLPYYRRRVTEEQIAALGSRDARVKRVHAEMACRYRDLVRKYPALRTDKLRVAFEGVESRAPVRCISRESERLILPPETARS
jgi:hypothetical protein